MALSVRRSGSWSSRLPGPSARSDAAAHVGEAHRDAHVGVVRRRPASPGSRRGARDPLPWATSPAGAAPNVMNPARCCGGAQDGCASGGPCVRFGAWHGLERRDERDAHAASRPWAARSRAGGPAATPGSYSPTRGRVGQMSSARCRPGSSVHRSSPAALDAVEHDLAFRPATTPGRSSLTVVRREARLVRPVGVHHVDLVVAVPVARGTRSCVPSGDQSGAASRVVLGQHGTSCSESWRRRC